MSLSQKDEETLPENLRNQLGYMDEVSSRKERG